MLCLLLLLPPMCSSVVITGYFEINGTQGDIVFAELGSTQTIEWINTSEFSPTFAWFKNGQFLNNTTNTLQLPDVEEDDFAEYVLRATVDDTSRDFAISVVSGVLWILAGGDWNDAGQWVDTSLWVD